MTPVEPGITPAASRPRAIWNAIVGAIAAVVGLAPHVLHHVGLLTGVALVAGTRGTIVFGLVGLVASLPLLIRLRRRFGTWKAPLIALTIFALTFALSSFVIGPALSGEESTSPDAPTSHEQHHVP